MTASYLAVGVAFVAMLAGVALVEVRRMRATGPDLLSLFLVIVLLQCGVPGAIIFLGLPFTDRTAPTGNEVFDHILSAVTPSTGLLVCVLTAWFLVWVYAGTEATGWLLAARRRRAGADAASDAAAVPAQELVVHEGRLLAVVAGGMALTLFSFWQLGDDLLVRYTNLILYRAGFEGIERTALNANAFALTQTWAWLSVVAAYVVADRHGRGARWGLVLVAILLFAVLGVSRRALFIPPLLAYLALVLWRGRWRLGAVALAMVPALAWLAFGKNLLAAVAAGSAVEQVADAYGSWVNALLRAACDQGITVVESLGTLTFLDLPPRFGIDHLLSLAQRFPEGLLGLDVDWPERIVRTSTTAFADANAQDVPPGLAGQMWLDFRLAGPVVWGLVFGAQVAVLQAFLNRVRRTGPAAAVFALLTFVVALPANSGSFDFSLSVDIIALGAILWWVLQVRPARG